MALYTLCVDLISQFLAIDACMILHWLPLGSALGSSFNEKAPSLGLVGVVLFSSAGGELSGGEWRVRKERPYCSL